jgi:hypothetical protein
MGLSNRGMNSAISWVVSLSIIMILILFVSILGLEVEPEWHYKMSAAESSRECNIALMNLMKSDASNGHNFAQAIMMEPLSIELEANEYIKTFFPTSEFRASDCSVEEQIDSEFVCCLQYVPEFDGKPKPVSLLFEISQKESEEVASDE